MSRWFGVVLVLWIAWVGSMVGARLFPPPQTEVIFFQVGQGDATLLRSQGQTLLVDVGPRVLSFDAGQRLLAPQLRARGITEIDALVLTTRTLTTLADCAACAISFGSTPCGSIGHFKSILS